MAAADRSTRKLRKKQLQDALIEQERLGDALDLAVGTSSEQAAYFRLRAASLDVSRRDRADKETEA
jgi:hypothetical protein